MLILEGMVLGLIGLLMVIKPSIIWMITEKWKSQDASEASTLYTMSIRFGGIILLFISIACFYALSL